MNLTRSIKSVIFTKRGLARFNWLTSKLNRPMVILYTASFATDIAMLVMPSSIGKWFAVVKVVGQTPMLLQGVASLHVDILKCLLRTYEFWFMSFINLTTHLVFCVYFRDLRAVSMIIYAAGLQINVYVDANLQTLQLAATSLVYIFYQIVMLVTVSLHLTPDTHFTKLIGYKGQTIYSQDFLFQSLTTIMVLMIQTAYRKCQFLKRMPTGSVLTQCVVYKCRVKLQMRDPRAPSRSVYESMTNEI